MTTAGPLVPGSVFAERFRIERPLAEGGMGQLYAVTNLATSHPCALKLSSADVCRAALPRSRAARHLTDRSTLAALAWSAQ